MTETATTTEAGEAARVAQPPQWRFFTPSAKTMRHIVVEVLIVAVGVLLALGIEQLRQYWLQRGLAADTRVLLRTEVERNISNIESAMQRLADVYPKVEAQPAEAPAFITANSGGAPLQFDAAFNVALQTGAFSYLDPQERKTFSEVYMSQEALDERSRLFTPLVDEVASWPSGALDDADDERDRARHVRRWKRAAVAQFTSMCRQMIRNRIALGADYPDNHEGTLCRSVSPLTTDLDALIAGRNAPRKPAEQPAPEAPT
jgi:hypothetical protein